MDILVNLGLVAAGIAMLCLGGNWLVGGGVSLARRFGVPSIIIGMTVVAYGTSTPELAASVAAAINGHGNIILGNVVGSNVANVGLVIGISASLAALAIGRRTIRREIPIMLGFSVLLVGMALDGAVSQAEGGVMLAVLAGFTWYTLRRTKTAKPEPGAGRSDTSYVRSLGTMGMGVGLLYLGAILTVDHAVAIAETFGISPRIIAITVIAIGTSLPELITTVIAVRRGHTDIGVGNIVGSNILNILLIMGVAAAISDIPVEPVVFVDFAVMIAFSGALFAALVSGRIARPVGLALVSGYAAYLLGSLFM